MLQRAKRGRGNRGSGEVEVRVCGATVGGPEPETSPKRGQNEPETSPKRGYLPSICPRFTLDSPSTRFYQLPRLLLVLSSPEPRPVSRTPSLETSFCVRLGVEKGSFWAHFDLVPTLQKKKPNPQFSLPPRHRKLWCLLREASDFGTGCETPRSNAGVSKSEQWLGSQIQAPPPPRPSKTRSERFIVLL